MTKYIVIGEIFSSGGANLYKNPSDQTVYVGEENARDLARIFLHNVYVFSIINITKMY